MNSGQGGVERTMEMVLEHKVAVIYGAGGPIGGAVARAFAREGARVFLAGRTKAKLDALAGAIRAAGGVADTAVVDALDEWRAHGLNTPEEHMSQHQLPIAIIGGGPVGLAAGLMGMQLAGLSVLAVAPTVAGALIYVMLFGAGSGTLMIMRAALLAERYGPEHYGSINGALSLALTGARTLAPIGAGALAAL
jgi:NAD(P)-dependent dehydrogenase (short-subunit alcohol dehydrogenase family)